MFMVDIAVPRDIEPQVGELDDVFLYTVDDLADIIAENRRAREHAAQDAEQIIEQGVSAYLRDVRARAASETVRAYRSLAEAQAEEELERALKRLRAGEAPEAVLQRFSRSLTNKLTHPPTARLREAAPPGATRWWPTAVASLASTPATSTNRPAPPGRTARNHTP